MTMHTQKSISGFIASDPKLTYHHDGNPRFYARFKKEHYREEPDGSFTQLEPTFHHLVIRRKTAERAHEMFAEGDAFIAEGYVRRYSYQRDGRQVEGEEFVAKKIGHDTARSRYTVDRTPRDRAVDHEDRALDRRGGFPSPDPPSYGAAGSAASVLGQ
ncbi:single-stranded DNA-binding protein [Aeromicrobium sp. PE09-221]|uniref:single-stranded DNA-binding protein n=1 Tax=Aeromicrobium sp. PE09-221 TaxID=1898043 RepID=UPI000B3EB59C|nr:single-stranded DNA-binding protein [Aeromicrobium sp. PE09-221]OUZ07235.1 single-stranded DNA-binding protein [Aeromicrobium sp. PE09-221]